MKSQAEIAGHLARSSSPRPQKGTVLPDVQLLMQGGSTRLLSEVRNRHNLVMVLTAGHDFNHILDLFNAVDGALNEQNTRVLIITSEAAALKDSSGELAIDPEFQIHQTLGAVGEDGKPIATIYITDRFGEVFAILRNGETRALVWNDIIGWLEFVNQQCDECSPPEW